MILFQYLIDQSVKKKPKIRLFSILRTASLSLKVCLLLGPAWKVILEIQKKIKSSKRLLNNLPSTL